MAPTDTKFQFNFFNAHLKFNHILASLLSIGQKQRTPAIFKGNMFPTGKCGIEVSVTVNSLAGEGETGDCWVFTGTLADGKLVDCFIRLSDGAGSIVEK